MAKKRESTPGENLAKQIIEQYNPKSVADISDDTDKLEDFNNKIKVAKRIGYGYRDDDFFFTLIRYLSIPSVRSPSHKNSDEPLFYQSSLFCVIILFNFQNNCESEFHIFGVKIMTYITVVLFGYSFYTFYSVAVNKFIAFGCL